MERNAEGSCEGSGVGNSLYASEYGGYCKDSAYGFESLWQADTVHDVDRHYSRGLQTAGCTPGLFEISGFRSLAFSLFGAVATSSFHRQFQRFAS